jgi:hypothetical protein
VTVTADRPDRRDFLRFTRRLNELRRYRYRLTFLMDVGVREPFSAASSWTSGGAVASNCSGLAIDDSEPWLGPPAAEEFSEFCSPSIFMSVPDKASSIILTGRPSGALRIFLRRRLLPRL